MEPDDLVFVPAFDPFYERIIVIGEVGRPQIVTYREGLTVLDAILMVGGPTPFASQNGTKIIRMNGSGKKTVMKVKLKNLLKGDISKNVELQPNDTIVVPQSLF
jgi:polysaccharide export outer membrane protein